MTEKKTILRDLNSLHHRLNSQLEDARNTILAAQTLTERLSMLSDTPDLPRKSVEQPIRQNRLMSPDEVTEFLGVSKMTLWRMRTSGRFPQPIQISSRRIAWKTESIEDWMTLNEVRRTK